MILSRSYFFIFLVLEVVVGDLQVECCFLLLRGGLDSVDECYLTHQNPVMKSTTNSCIVLFGILGFLLVVYVPLPQISSEDKLLACLDPSNTQC